MTSGLTSGGHDEDVVDLIKLSNKQKQAELFWESAAGQIWTHPDDAILHDYREFGVSKEIPCDGLIGVATGAQLTSLYKNLNRAFPRFLRPSHPAIIFPYYDLPGHFSGFLIWQTNRSGESSRVFLPVQFMPTVRPEAGYFLLTNALLPTHDILKDNLFLVSDPVWALKAQTVQLRHDAPLLPICCSYFGREAVSYGTSLYNFKHGKKLVSGDVISPDIVSQAANSRGYVCIPPSSGDFLNQSPLKTVKRLSAIYRSAKTWQVALAAELKKLEPTAAIEFAANLSISRNKLQDFLRTKTELQEIHILEILNRATPHQIIELGSVHSSSTEVIERDDGWYTASGICITTCAPRITQIVYTKNGGKYYEGYIKKQNTTVEFFATAQIIEKIGLLTYAEQLLASKNLLVVSATRWNRRAVTIALRLHPPAVFTISDKLGWDDDAREFRFSTYSIANTGEILPPKCPQLQQSRNFDFPEPSTAAPLEITTLLTQSYENAFVWTVAAAVLANLVAPIMGVQCSPVAISKESYPIALDVGRAMCCDIVPADKPRLMSKITDSSLMLTLKNKSELNLKSLMLRGLNQPVFMGLPDAGILSALTHQWSGISADIDTAATVDYEALKFVVPNYIQRVLRSRAGLIGTSAQLIKSILRDVHKWLDETYAATFNLNAAENYLYHPDMAHVFLMHNLNNAISEGYLDVLPRHRLSRQTQNYILRTADYWWINKQSVNAYLTKNCVAPDWKTLLNCFENEQIFGGEETVNKIRWFLLDKSWCDSFWADYKEKDVG